MGRGAAPGKEKVEWLSLRDAAAATHVARGWIVVMIQQGRLLNRTNSAGQPEVLLGNLCAHKQQTLSQLETLEQKLLFLLDGDWVTYKDLNEAIPSQAYNRGIKQALERLTDQGLIEESEYDNRGRKGAMYRVINDTGKE